MSHVAARTGDAGKRVDEGECNSAGQRGEVERDLRVFPAALVTQVGLGAHERRMHTFTCKERVIDAS